MFAAVLAVQAATFFVLSAILVHQGEYRLGAAQLLLAAITVLVYA